MNTLRAVGRRLFLRGAGAAAIAAPSMLAQAQQQTMGEVLGGGSGFPPNINPTATSPVLQALYDAQSAAYENNERVRTIVKRSIWECFTSHTHTHPL